MATCSARHRMGGASDHGTVFEILKTSSGYASTPTTLVSFNGKDGSHPAGGLIMDANGDLVGTTLTGGASDDGTVFDIAMGSDHITTLVNFNLANGGLPHGDLVFDADGNLFGTTSNGGASNDGTVFQINGAGFFV